MEISTLPQNPPPIPIRAWTDQNLMALPDFSFPVADLFPQFDF